MAQENNARRPARNVLSRRAAISYAQRGLLLLKRSLEEKTPPQIDSVYGYVPGLMIKSESAVDGLYFVDAEARLSELMGRENPKDSDDVESEYIDNEKEEDDVNEYDEDDNS